MLKDLFQNRLFIGALAFFVLCVGGSLLYMQHVAQQGSEYAAETQDRVAQWTEKQKPTTEGKAGDTSQGGHFHADGTWHAAEPPETPSFAEVDTSEPVQVSNISAPQYNDNAGAGNPHPFKSVPVDLYDFQTTKATMIENINFVKANWDPKVYNREVSIAQAISENIANAANLPIFTSEQRQELIQLHLDLLEFKGIDGARVKALEEQGHTRAEALKITTDETLQRWGVK